MEKLNSRLFAIVKPNPSSTKGTLTNVLTYNLKTSQGVEVVGIDTAGDIRIFNRDKVLYIINFNRSNLKFEELKNLLLSKDPDGFKLAIEVLKNENCIIYNKYEEKI